MTRWPKLEFLLTAALAGAAGTGLVFLAGCRSLPDNQNLRRFEFKQSYMGTLFSLILYGSDETQVREASDAAFARIATLEQMMTDYDPESELMQLCQRPVGKPVRVSDELFDVLQRAQRLAELTDGAFDVTVGPLVRLWRRAQRTGTLPSPEMLARAREAVGYRKLTLDSRSRTVTLTAPSMQLDLGSIGKGYAADKALEVLKQRGITRALVAASGDIAVSDPPPGCRGWRVGIGTMDGARNELARNLLLRNAAVSTSGDTEQFAVIGGERYSHIVDPRAGVGLTERLQVSIVAKRAADADSFATAVSTLGVTRGLGLVNSQPSMAAFILRKEGGRTEIFESRRFKNIPRVHTESLAPQD